MSDFDKALAMAREWMQRYPRRDITEQSYLVHQLLVELLHQHLEQADLLTLIRMMSEARAEAYMDAWRKGFESGKSLPSLRENVA